MSIRYFKPLFLFILGWLLLIAVLDFRSLALINGIAQLLLFLPVVCLPLWFTGRMSYVDIGWPLGLTVIGVLTLLIADGDTTRKYIIGFIYLFVGLRMATMGVRLWLNGHLDKELPRYQFQRRRWQKLGKTNLPLAMQIEVIVQALANASFLAVPAFIIANNVSHEYSALEYLGLLIWVAAFVMETIADRQKEAFIHNMNAQGLEGKVCNTGMWRYSRHPNYFAEWMVWNALVIAAIPSWFAMYESTNTVLWGLLGVALLFTSRSMYVTLVYYTGAIPSEYYSVQKRPEYKDYQKTTSMFFPRLSKSK